MKTVDEYVRLCSLSDIEKDHTKIVRIDEREILLVRADNEIHAFENLCTHEEMPIGEVAVHCGEIQCPRHGGKFDMKTGRAIGLPAVIDLKSYDVRVDNGEVYISLN